MGKEDDQPSVSSGKQGQQPQWADGLKQLYDAVVDEPLPDSFKDLLSQLDDKSSDESSQN